MALREVIAVTSEAGFVPGCPQCKVEGKHTCGAQNKDEPAYLLKCPRCDRILGGWPSHILRDAELERFRSNPGTASEKHSSDSNL
jgi:hypothetical protein